MIRSAVLVSGKGTKLQSLLDSVFFGEIPELQLVAVISSDAGAYALKRARNAGIRDRRRRAERVSERHVVRPWPSATAQGYGH